MKVLKKKIVDLKISSRKSFDPLKGLVMEIFRGRKLKSIFEDLLIGSIEYENKTLSQRDFFHLYI